LVALAFAEQAAWALLMGLFFSGNSADHLR
jgi:hypothetical protein